jgi:hypothetical protein
MFRFSGRDAAALQKAKEGVIPIPHFEKLCDRAGETRQQVFAVDEPAGTNQWAISRDENLTPARPLVGLWSKPSTRIQTSR